MINQRDKKIAFSFNSPIILTFAIACVIIQLINTITGDAANRLLFSVGRRGLTNPLAYLNCVFHVLGHSGWQHLLNNMMYLLLIGPILEEKYGSVNILIVILATAVITGLLTLIAFPHVVLCGASGVVFAMILLTSITQYTDHTIPITFVLVAIMYLGSEIYNGIFVADDTSQMAHILGGVVGSILGFIMNKNKMSRFQR